MSYGLESSDNPVGCTSKSENGIWRRSLLVLLYRKDIDVSDFMILQKKDGRKYIDDNHYFWFSTAESRMVPNGSRSLVACIAAVASGGGRGDDFHNFFDPAQVDGIVPGKIGEWNSWERW